MCVEIAEFGAARETLPPSDKKRRLLGKSAVNLSYQSVTAQFDNLTQDVGTMVYTAPEAWFGGDYGYSVDVWAFGTIIFELLTFQMFSPGRKAVDRVASVLTRLGCQEEAESHILGPLQPPLVAAAVHALSEGGGHTLPSLASCAASAPPRGLWDQVTAALMWRPQARITAKVLSQSLPRPDITEPAAHAPQPAKGCVDASQPVAEFPAGLPAGLSMTQSTKSPAGSMDLTTLPRCIPSTRQGVMVCKCSGHCDMVGHRTRANKKQQVCTNMHLEGSDFCAGCKCSIKSCPRPRNTGELCYGHGNALAKLP